MPGQGHLFVFENVGGSSWFHVLRGVAGKNGEGAGGREEARGEFSGICARKHREEEMLKKNDHACSLQPTQASTLKRRTSLAASECN